MRASIGPKKKFTRQNLKSFTNIHMYLPQQNAFEVYFVLYLLKFVFTNFSFSFIFIQNISVGVEDINLVVAFLQNFKISILWYVIQCTFCTDFYLIRVYLFYVAFWWKRNLIGKFKFLQIKPVLDTVYCTKNENIYNQ